MKKTLQTMPKTLALLIFAWMLAAVCFALPLTLESAQTAGEIVNNAENPSLLASTVPAANIAPGLNVYTGTANALTFDSAADADWFTATAGVGLSVVSTDKIYGTANGALRLAVPQSGGTAFYPTLTTTMATSRSPPSSPAFPTRTAMKSWSQDRSSCTASRSFTAPSSRLPSKAPLTARPRRKRQNNGSGHAFVTFLLNQPLFRTPFFRRETDNRCLPAFFAFFRC